MENLYLCYGQPFIQSTSFVLRLILLEREKVCADKSCVVSMHPNRTCWTVCRIFPPFYFTLQSEPIRPIPFFFISQMMQPKCQFASRLQKMNPEKIEADVAAASASQISLQGFSSLHYNVSYKRAPWNWCYGLWMYWSKTICLSHVEFCFPCHMRILNGKNKLYADIYKPISK